VSVLYGCSRAPTARTVWLPLHITSFSCHPHLLKLHGLFTARLPYGTVYLWTSRPSSDSEVARCNSDPDQWCTYACI